MESNSIHDKSDRGLQELALLSQQELLASQTLLDLWNTSTSASATSWSTYVPPSARTSQVLQSIEHTEHGQFVPLFPPPMQTVTAPFSSEEEEEEEELIESDDTEDMVPSSMRSAPRYTGSAPRELGHVASFDQTSSSPPSPPSSPFSSSSLASLQQLSLSSHKGSPEAITFSLPPLGRDEMQPSNLSSLPSVRLPRSQFPWSETPGHRGSLQDIPFQTREPSSSSHLHPGSRTPHHSLLAGRQALPLRRANSAESQRSAPVPMLPRKRPSSDCILNTSVSSKGPNPLSPTSPPSSSQHSSSASLGTSPTNSSQKPRPKKKRRRRDEIERKFTCPVGDCAKSYGSEGALKTHVKLKHPEIYVDQFAWKGCTTTTPVPSGIPPSSSSQPPHVDRAALAL